MRSPGHPAHVRLCRTRRPQFRYQVEKRKPMTKTLTSQAPPSVGAAVLPPGSPYSTGADQAPVVEVVSLPSLRRHPVPPGAKTAPCREATPAERARIFAALHA